MNVYGTLLGVALVELGAVGALWWHSETQRRRLQRAYTLHKGLLEANEDALFVLDRALTIQHTNHAVRKLFGVEVTGHSLSDVLTQPEIEALLQDAMRMEGERVERRVEFQQHVTLARALTVGHGAAMLAVLTLHDVTELEHLERARREMVANITHELSHPITAIGLLAETLLNVAEHEKPKRIRKMAKNILREANTLAQLVQEMRDLSLIESGQMPIRLTPSPLHAMIAAAVEQLHALAENKGQTVTVHVAPEIVVLADSEQMQRALKNILHNAIKFSPEGSQIIVTATAGPNEVVISIQDNGPGIPQEDLARIFERFFQVDRVRREGTGLGLAIVRHIVRAHGGRVWAESVEGQGATFHIALALAEPQSEMSSL